MKLLRLLIIVVYNYIAFKRFREEVSLEFGIARVEAQDEYRIWQYCERIRIERLFNDLTSILKETTDFLSLINTYDNNHETNQTTNPIGNNDVAGGGNGAIIHKQSPVL